MTAILLAQIAFAGVTNPLPSEIQLLKGESGRFKFQIQTIAHPYAVICSYAVEENPIFNLRFDDAELIVEGNQVKDFYGTVTAPRKLDYGKYSAKFCISCKDIQNPPQPGANVEIRTCGIPINIDVVKQRTVQNMFIPPKQRSPLFFPLIIAIIIILILLAILIYFLLKNRKSKKEAKPPIEKEAKPKKSKNVSKKRS